MTCRPSDIHWRDALYNAVRQMPGGVNAAASHLTERRGRAITGESLRKKLRGVEGESVSLEIAELLNMVRSSVAYRRTATLKLLKELMGGKTDDS